MISITLFCVNSSSHFRGQVNFQDTKYIYKLSYSYMYSMNICGHIKAFLHAYRVRHIFYYSGIIKTLKF